MVVEGGGGVVGGGGGGGAGAGGGTGGNGGVFDMCVLTRHSASVFMRCDGDSGAHVAGGGGGDNHNQDDSDDDDDGDGDDRWAQQTKVCIIAVLLLQALGCDGP